MNSGSHHLGISLHCISVVSQAMQAKETTEWGSPSARQMRQKPKQSQSLLADFNFLKLQEDSFFLWHVPVDCDLKNGRSYKLNYPARVLGIFPKDEECAHEQTGCAHLEVLICGLLCQQLHGLGRERLVSEVAGAVLDEHRDTFIQSVPEEKVLLRDSNIGFIHWAPTPASPRHAALGETGQGT